MLRSGWYIPVQPPAALEPLLSCAWTAVPTGRHRLVPDACADLLWTSDGRLIFCAPETSAWSFELPAGTTAVGVRFRPGVPFALWGVDQAALAGERLDAADVLGARTAASWRHSVSRPGTLAERRDRLTDAVAHSYPGRCNDPFADAVLAHLERHPSATVDELARVTCVHPRTLHRRCTRLFGYGPATLARLLRFQRFLSCAAAAERPTLAGLAADAGYTDQAHLAHECRRLTDRSVSEYLGEYFPTFPDMSDPYKTRAGAAG